jgi:hypothetical protein
MREGSGDGDEEDVRQPVVDVDVALELGELRGSVEHIASDLGELASDVGRTLDAMGHMLNDTRSALQSIQFTMSALLLVTIAATVLILGTLRHWF